MVWVVSLWTMKVIPHSLTPVFSENMAFRVSKSPVSLRPKNLNCALPPRFIRQGYTKIYFGENQLFPSLISLSPLSTPHPSTFQRTPVRTFISFNRDFILDMDSSLGFGSISYYYSLYSNSLSLRLHSFKA